MSFNLRLIPVLTATAVLSVGVAATSAAETKASARYEVPRLADGSPDFQGFWKNSTATPLERSPELGTRRSYSTEEALAIREAAIARVEEDAKPTDPNAPAPEAKALPPVGNYNLFWTDRGSDVVEIDGELRTSMVIDPPNGRIPPLTKAAQQRLRESRQQRGNSEGPEARSLGERCILSFGSSSGPPMLPTMYNSNYQIIQAPGYVVFLVEMVHDARIIRIEDEAFPTEVKRWLGDSVGRWEGDTLVVTTRNFRPEQSFRGSSEDAVITERFTRVADNKIVYRWTVEDPKTFTAPFTAELAFHKTDEQVYEYACHEGNIGMEGILQGARREEALESK